MKQNNDDFWESDDVMTEEEAEAATQFLSSNDDSSESIVQSEEQTIDDDEMDFQVLKDASLRLEQGNLYKMLLKHDLFEGVDADKRAIANVQRELRAFIRERLEILVGLKADPKIAPKITQTNLPFSELEIDVLKQFLSKAIGNKAPEISNPPSPSAPKLAQIQKSTPPAKLKPVINKPAPALQQRPQASKPQRPPEKPSNDGLTKPPSEMTAAELIEYNKKVSNRQMRQKAMAIKKTPMPDSQQLENMYASRVQTNNGANLIGAILTKMGKGPPGLIENVGGEYEDSNDGRI